MAENNDLGALSYSLNIDISQLPDTIRSVEKQLSTISTVADISTRVDSNQLIGAIKHALMAEDFKLKVSLDSSFKTAISNAASLLNNATGGSGNADQLGHIDSLIKKLKELEEQYKNLPKGSDPSKLVSEFASVQNELAKAGKNLSAAFNKSWDEIDRMAEKTIGDLKKKIKSLEQYKLNIPLSDTDELSRMESLINKLKGDISALFQTQSVNPFQLPEDSIKEIETKIKALREIHSFSPINSKEFLDADRAVTGLRDKLNSIGKLSWDDALKLPEDTIEEIKRKLKEIESLRIKTPIDSVQLQDANREVERLKKLLSDINNPPKVARSFAEVMGMDTNTLNQVTDKLNEIRRLRGEINVNNPNGLTQINSLNKAEADLLRIQQQRLGTNRDINETYAAQTGLVDNLTSKALAYFSLEKMQQFANKLIDIRGEFEKQQVALQVILQSKDQADRLFSQVVDLGLKSPFSIMQLNSYVKGLAAYRIETDQLFNTTKRLADISSGLGVDMGRLILAYGQVRAASVLRGQEVRQFTEAGIPLIESLADQFTKLEGRVVSTNEVFDKISNRLVPFEMVRDVLFEMTDAGGVFFNMQEKQAETLGAKWKNLQDAIDVMYNSIGQEKQGFLKGMAEGLTDMTENWRVILDYIESAIVALGTYKMLSLSAGSSDVLVKSLMATRNVSEDVAKRFISMQTGISGGFNRIGVSVKALSRSFKSFIATNGWMLLAAAIAGVAVKLYNAYQESERLNKELGKIGAEGLRDVRALEEAHSDLAKKIRETNEGTVARKEAIDKLNNQFGSYYSTMLTEVNALQMLASEYETVNAKIRENTKLKTQDKAREAVSNEFETDKRRGDIVKKLSSLGVDDKDITNLLDKANEKIDQLYSKYGYGNVYGGMIENVLSAAAKDYELPTEQLEKLSGSSIQKTFADYARARKNEEKAIRTAMAGVDAEFGDSFKGSKKDLAIFEEREKMILDSLKKREEELRNTYSNQNVLDERLVATRRHHYEQLRDLSKEYSNYKLSEYDAELKRAEITSTKIRDAVRNSLGYDSKYFAPFSSFTDAKSMQDAYKGMTDIIADPTKDDAVIKDAKDRLEALKKVAAELGVILDPKSTTKGSKEAEDSRFNQYKAEISLVKQAYSDYGKYVELIGEEEAKKRIAVKYGDQFARLFRNEADAIKYATDATAYYNKVQAQLAKGTSKKDIALRNAVSKEIGSTETKDDIKNLGEEWTKLKESLAIDKEAYGLLDSFLEAGLDKHTAKSVVEDYFKELGINVSLEYDKFSDKAKQVFNAMRPGVAGTKSGRNLKKDFLPDLDLSVLKKYQDYNSQRLAIEHKFDKDLELLREQRAQAETDGNKDLTQYLDRAIAQATKDKGEALISFDFEQLKKTPEYVRAFENLRDTSTETLNGLLVQLEQTKQMAAQVLTPDQLRSYTDTIQAIMDELLSRDLFAGIVQLRKEAAQADAELIEAEKRLKAVMSGEDTSISAAQALSAYNKAKDKAIKKNNQLRSAEKKATSQIEELGRAIEDVGNSIGGVSGEIVSLIGSITTTVMFAVEGVKAVATAGATAISTVEKASVILAIISAALQIATKIASLFAADYSDYNKAKAAYESYIEVLDKVIQKQKELAETLTGDNARRAYEEAIDLIKEQTRVTEQLARMRLGQGKSAGSHSMDYRMWKGSYKFDGKNWRDVANEAVRGLEEAGLGSVKFTGMYDMLDMTVEQLDWIRKKYAGLWGAMDDDFKEYLESIIDSKEAIQEVIEAQKETLTGLSFDTLKDSLDDLVQAADTTFEMVGDSFEDHMRNAVLNFVKNKYLTAALEDWYSQFANAYSDGKLSKDEVDELRKMYENAYNKAQDMYDSALDVAGISKENSELSGLSKGIQGLTESTAQIIEAYLNTIRDVVISISKTGEHQLAIQQASLLIQTQILTEVTTMGAATVSIGAAIRSVIAQSSGDRGAGFRVFLQP